MSVPSLPLERRSIAVTGITLDAQQIQNAPAAVRQWIEQQVLAALGLASSPMLPSKSPHLAACTEAQANDLLNQIAAMPPAVRVFFAFARPDISFGEPRVMAFRLVDIQHHADLESITKLLDCLDLINHNFALLRNDPAARFCGFDNEGHCFIPSATQRSIAALQERMAQGPSTQTATGLGSK